MTNKLDKFLLLMWKNWTLLRRRPIHTAFEIIFPVAICFVLVAIRGLIDIENVEESSYEAFNLTLQGGGGYSICDLWNQKNPVAYSPRNSLLRKVINSTCPIAMVEEYESSTRLNQAIDANTEFNFAVEFGDHLRDIVNSSELPNDLTVTLRLPTVTGYGKREWHTNRLYPVFQTPGPRSFGAQYGGYPNYYSRSFLYLQQAITLALMNDGDFDLESQTVKIQMNRFPYPKWVDDQFNSNQMEIMISLLIMISFMYNFINTVRAITTEKEKQLKESMKIMGLPGWLHWVAWFVRSFTLLLIAIIIMVITVKINVNVSPVFSHSDGTVLFIFLVLFACCTVTFSFLVSVFFTKANTAAAVGSLIFFLQYLPYTLQMQQESGEASLAVVLGSCLLANSALSFGLSIVLKFESIEEGIHWSNLWTGSSPDVDITLGAVFLMLLLDMFLYLAIALYIEAVFPGEFGVPEPWYFPFTRAYWCSAAQILDTETSRHNQGEYFEEFNEKLPIGIQLENLSKIFGNNKAVNQLNLDMYEGHITVLLGHNGAGKTTTMNMMTGMFPPSKGTAVVSGYDVRTSVQSVRDSMGLCLQHNVLFDNLTVREHLYFFGKLKGSDEINQEIDNYIELLELQDKRNALSKTLSGGMKRKLSIGMALCGKSKVVMLDEPTAGMDPSARRAIWNFLQKQKQGRTILLTTHFMDEADLLGDRIAIMAGGELQCCGSSFFLKRKYGAGYYLIMDIASHCEPLKVTALLKNHIPYIEIFSHVGSELTYQLSENESWKFEAMLQNLESNINVLGVRSYGVSLTTLEEVFMKVGAEHDDKTSNGYEKKITMNNSSQWKTELLIGLPLLKNQFIAMFVKKVFSILRTWYLLALQIVVPSILLIITILNGRNYVPKSTFPSLFITLGSYHDPVTLFSGTENDSYIYQDVLKGHKLIRVQDISKEILDLTTTSPSTVKMHYIAAASISGNVTTAWFNGDPYHSTPLALGLVLNTFYKQKLGSSKSINFANHPLPVPLNVQLNDFTFDIMGFQLAMEFGYGMAFAASFYILFYIRERISKAKHLQFVSGVNVFVFWGTSFLIDLITYFATTCVILITLVVLQEDGFKTTEDLGRVTLVLVYFGFFMLPFVYLASFLFSLPSSGFSRMVLVGAVAGIVGISAMSVLEIQTLDLLHVAKPLHWVLLFIPFYTIAKGIYDISSIYNLRKICSGSASSCESQPLCCGLGDYYSMGSPGLGRNIIISFLMSFALFAVLIFNEYGFFSYLLNKIINYNKPPRHDIDLEEDVQEENKKIRDSLESVLNSKNALVLRDVTKYYKNFLAVNGLCLGVKPYECFGLLGVNGAGKTSTFKMMTGDEQISYGEAWVIGMNLKRQQKEVQKLIGYCPQFDALLDDLTARETLRIFALIRGVPMEKCKELGENLAHEFDFFKHLDKKVKELSGGNKRKLSTAIALIGDPPVIYLDEPTTGMDPATKRYLWTALAKLRDSGKSIILTSHSMEECEALCTRIAIMVNGNFQCLGSTQRLKNKFAQGYNLTLKVKRVANNLDAEISAIDNFIQKHFPGALLKEKYQELLSYQLVNNSLPWSKMFGILERSKKELHIEDYFLGQCSLEQVFLSFTKYQQ